jgi:hypothetical protein
LTAYAPPDPWDDSFYNASSITWVIFNLFFYFVIGTILLNVMLAIIVDTFGGLQKKKKTNKKRREYSQLIFGQLFLTEITY